MGALVPAIVAVTLGAACVADIDHPLAREAMQGARAERSLCSIGQSSGSCVLSSSGIVVAGLLSRAPLWVMTLVLPVPSFVILLVAGGLGAAFLGEEL